MRRPRPNPRPAADVPPVELEIARVGFQGDGAPLGGVPHVPFTLPGERVLARVAADRGDVVEVLAPSPDRVAPPCPHFGVCGGCALQHWEHAPYLAWKVEQIRLSLARERIETDFAPAFSARPGTRRRLAMHARRGSRDEAVLGFKGRRSWSVVPVAVCPISDPRLVAAFPLLRKLAAPLFEHPKSAPTLHVTLTDTGLDVDITGVEARSGGLSADARMRLAQIASESDLARVTLAGEIAYGARDPMVRFGRAAVALPAGGFLQAVADAEEAIARVAVAAVQGADTVADLFCGAGAFTFRLAEHATVVAADASAPAIRALTAGLATAPGLKGVRAEARDLMRRPMLASELKRVDVAVFDPPRAGAEAQAAELARSTLATVVGVSCNPTTFARDAAILVAAGFHLAQVVPVDQFLWSPHIELAGVFRR